MYSRAWSTFAVSSGPADNPVGHPLQSARVPRAPAAIGGSYAQNCHRSRADAVAARVQRCDANASAEPRCASTASGRRDDRNRLPLGPPNRGRDRRPGNRDAHRYQWCAIHVAEGLHGLARWVRGRGRRRSGTNRAHDRREILDVSRQLLWVVGRRRSRSLSGRDRNQAPRRKGDEVRVGEPSRLAHTSAARRLSPSSKRSAAKAPAKLEGRTCRGSVGYPSRAADFSHGMFAT